MNAPRYFSEAQIEIIATPAAVWTVLGDFHGVAKWARGVKVQPLGAAKTGIGAGRCATIPGLGTVDEVIVEWEPEKRLSYSVTPVSVFGTGVARWRLEPAGAGKTRVIQRFEYGMRFGVIGALLRALVVKRKMAQTQPHVLAQLKKSVESHSVA